MSANPESDYALSDVSCRILVLSSRISRAKSCIQRIQSGGKGQSSPSSNNISDASTLSDSSESSEDSIKIPWTITNKYYSALVHFSAHRMHGLSPHQVQNIPAVIFVWSQGESYKNHIERIVQDLSGYEPEVCLAIRLAPHTSSPSTSLISDEEEGHDDEIDGFLSSYGFEFIDGAENNAGRNVEGEILDEEAWSSEIPGIERVLDALSTIMWPSMKTMSKFDARLPQTRTRERERALLDWANASDDISLSVAEEIAASSSEQMSANTKAMKREMEELARWLEEDDQLRDDPWKSAVSAGGMTMSPTAMETGGKLFGSTKATFGFDDDFTVFVSAPALGATEISGRTTPDAPVDLSPSGLHAGSLYRSLGSVSDFGGSEDERDAKDDDIDDELPSKEEIMATSSRIFGTSKFLLPSTIETHTTESVQTEDQPSVPAVLKTFSDDDDLDVFVENPAADDDGSYDMESFDLSKVLGALQEMKAEIANIEDEGERRKAAARVALGLVYGLEADG